MDFDTKSIFQVGLSGILHYKTTQENFQNLLPLPHREKHGNKTAQRRHCRFTDACNLPSPTPILQYLDILQDGEEIPDEAPGLPRNPGHDFNPGHLSQNLRMPNGQRRTFLRKVEHLTYSPGKAREILRWLTPHAVHARSYGCSRIRLCSASICSHLRSSPCRDLLRSHLRAEAPQYSRLIS